MCLRQQLCFRLGSVTLTLMLCLLLCLSITCITCQLTFTGHDATFHGMLCSPLSHDFGEVHTRLSCAVQCDRHVSCAGFFHSGTARRCFGVSHSLSSTQDCSSVGSNSSYRFYAKGCGAPPAVANADVSLGGVAIGDVRNYSCSTDYVMRNLVTMRTTCQSDRTWSATVFDCVWDCGAAPLMLYSTLNPGETVELTVRIYTCDTGYGAAGQVATTCEAGTGWTNPQFTCVLLGCPSGWHMIDNSCYFTPGGGVGYKDDVFAAMDYCHAQDAYLVQLETEPEANAFTSWFLAAYTGISGWLGLSDNDSEGTWLWINSSELANYTCWNIAQPNGGTSDNFVRFRGENGLWGDVAFNYTGGLQPLCEKSALQL